MSRFDRRSVAARAGVSLAAFLGMSTLAGCGASSPDYYTLKPWPGPAGRGGPQTLEVHTPTIGSYLDRDYIVRNDNNYRLKLDDDAAWGEPLAQMIGRTVAADLRQRLPDTNVFSQGDAVATDAQGFVDMDISRFAQDASGQAELSAVLSVHTPGEGPFRSRTLHLTAPLEQGAGKPTAALVAALSRLLGQLADEASTEARMLPPVPRSAAAPAEPVSADIPVGDTRSGPPLSLVPPNR
jgi:uncharacterized protein